MKKDIIPNSLACFVAYILGFVGIRFFAKITPDILNLLIGYSLTSIVLFILVLFFAKILEKIGIGNFSLKYLLIFILIIPNLFFIKSLNGVIGITDNMMLYYYLDILFSSGTLLIAYWVVIDLKVKIYEMIVDVTKNYRETLKFFITKESTRDELKIYAGNISSFIKEKRIDTFWDALLVIFIASAISIGLNYFVTIYPKIQLF